MSELADELVDAPDDVVDSSAGDEVVDDSPVARADETDTAASPATSSFDINDPQVQAQLAGMSQQSALALLEQLGLVSYQDDTPAPPDPLSDNYAAEQQAYLDAVLARQLGPIQQYVQAQQTAETNRVIDSALSAAAVAANLDGADSALLRSVAAHFATQPEYARYGATEAGVRATAQAAAQWLAGERKAAGEAAVQTYRKQIGEIQDTPAEPNGGGGGLTIEQKPKTYDQIIAKHVGRLG